MIDRDDLQWAEAFGEPVEVKLVVDGVELKDGDLILLVNQPKAIENGIRVIKLDKP